jgi:iron(III) transport system ATP-binding protein
MSVIELIQVDMIYSGGKGPAVQDITLSVESGEVLAVLGPSGSGKTTLLRLISGFEVPSRGRILLGGQEVSRPGYCLAPEERGVGMVFQDYALFPHLTVAENVAFGLFRYSPSERNRKTMEVLTLTGLAGLEKRYPHELSGGQQQRVALARALAPGPLVVLLDEPFSNLDPDMRSRMRHEIQQILRRLKTTAILVTHDHEEAFAMADRIAVINGGRLEQLDTPETVYHLPATPFVADFVGQADFLPGTVGWDGSIHSEIGLFPNEPDYPVGTRVVLMIRPDDIHVEPDADGQAHIVSRQFRGSENLYVVSLPSGQTVHSSEPSVVVHPPGTRVRIQLTATHTVVFKSLSMTGVMIG